MRKVERKKVVGVCDTDIFKKMVDGGDISARKVTEAVNEVVEINGYAETHIKTDNNEFDLVYYATNTGYLSSGSAVFLESVERYYGSVAKFSITKIQTKKGYTYKAVPIIESEEA